MAGRMQNYQLRNDQKRNDQQKKSRQKKFPLFWVLYLLFVIAMIIFWIRAVDYVKECLVRYEESQPVNSMETIIADLRKQGLESYVRIDGEMSRFDSQEAFAKAAQRLVSGKILDYAPAKGVQDPAAPKYELLADGEPVGFVSLKETSSENLFLNLLKVSEWALDHVEINAIIKGENSFEVTVPENYQVLVNGIAADDREKAPETQVSEEFAYAAEYVEVPSFVTYRGEGLLETPSIQILDQEGRQTEIAVEQKNTKTCASFMTFTESDIPEDLRKQVLENTERYTNFFSADLPGCKGSVSPIKDMFPKDSYYLDLADTYRREDMWMYSAHSTPVFKNEVVDHYIRYNEELFSCEVYFEKEMLLTKTGKKKVDVTNFRMYYGLLDGEWKILDMVTLLANE